MKLFGTDGIRGKAGHAPLVPETVARVGAALVKTFDGDQGSGIGDRGAAHRFVIGRDTRESGTWIEEERVLLFPEDTRKQRRVDTPPVDHNEHLVGRRIGEAAAGNDP